MLEGSGVGRGLRSTADLLLCLAFEVFFMSPVSAMLLCILAICSCILSGAYFIRREITFLVKKILVISQNYLTDPKSENQPNTMCHMSLWAIVVWGVASSGEWWLKELRKVIEIKDVVNARFVLIGLYYPRGLSLPLNTLCLLTLIIMMHDSQSQRIIALNLSIVSSRVKSRPLLLEGKKNPCPP